MNVGRHYSSSTFVWQATSGPLSVNIIVWKKGLWHFLGGISVSIPPFLLQLEVGFHLGDFLYLEKRSSNKITILIMLYFFCKAREPKLEYQEEEKPFEAVQVTFAEMRYGKQIGRNPTWWQQKDLFVTTRTVSKERGHKEAARASAL